MEKSIPLLVLVGPTAVGKTAVSVEVALKLGGEIVSADSMLVYRYMNIGTAKPTMEERRGIPHYMIDIIDPDESYSVALYQAQARQHIREIWERGKLPLLVGGTGLYIRSVIEPYHFTGAGVDEHFRSQLLKEAREKGAQALYQRLVEVDPETAAKVHPNNLKRVIRALEVYHLTGHPMSSALRQKGDGPPYNTLIIGLTMDRQRLYQRIEARVEQMLEMGLVDEVRSLLKRGYSPYLTSMQGLGYKEIIAYLRGLSTIEEAIYLLKRNTRRFAKRQFTWFKRDPRINWINIGHYTGITEIAQEITKRAEGVLLNTSKTN
ncbi:tRNA (adenosine(37)-N6)-dimethylallyltransferase MiaA [Desulfofundulus thermocisternus]|jgi:tRNA dimethylallyltransferase|uniref:tRNA (adenosine(37)-N6)-dimethylallyltransferase MiaA n=1 Tax=Desulfofundulus thermocisternus TaxID=42471 RepID=UPI0004824E5B|nr:tRNA (adenosine(37)-N6)-dimethylallyltransferase MiaA [Desulfofundulus thermocisternus]